MNFVVPWNSFLTFWFPLYGESEWVSLWSGKTIEPQRHAVSLLHLTSFCEIEEVTEVVKGEREVEKCSCGTIERSRTFTWTWSRVRNSNPRLLSRIFKCHLHNVILWFRIFHMWNFIYIERNTFIFQNKRGPIIEPCGTPQVLLVSESTTLKQVHRGGLSSALNLLSALGSAEEQVD